MVVTAALVREVAKAVVDMWDVTNCELCRIANALESANFSRIKERE